MNHTMYWVVQGEDDDEFENLVRYSNIVDEEEYEEEDDNPGGFEGIQKGSNICETTQDEDQTEIKPWDPSEFFFARIQ